MGNKQPRAHQSQRAGPGAQGLRLVASDAPGNASQLAVSDSEPRVTSAYSPLEIPINVEAKISGISSSGPPAP